MPGIGTDEGDDDQRRHPDHLRQCRGDGYTGTELQDAINGGRQLGFRDDCTAGPCAWASSRPPDGSRKRQHTPKIAFVAALRDYASSSGKNVPDEVDLLVRAMSMGKLHHAT